MKIFCKVRNSWFVENYELIFTLYNQCNVKKLKKNRPNDHEISSYRWTNKSDELWVIYSGSYSMDTWPTAGQDREWTQTTKGQGHRGADTGGQWQFQQSPSCTADRQKEEAEKGREREARRKKSKNAKPVSLRRNIRYCHFVYLWIVCTLSLPLHSMFISSEDLYPLSLPLHSMVISSEEDLCR